MKNTLMALVTITERVINDELLPANSIIGMKVYVHNSTLVCISSYTHCQYGLCSHVPIITSSKSECEAVMNNIINDSKIENHSVFGDLTLMKNNYLTNMPDPVLMAMAKI